MHFRETMMKTSFALALLACCGLSSGALAQTGTAEWLDCDLATDDCKALRAAYLDQVSSCMSERQKIADRTLGSTRSNGPQTTRARHILCTDEVRATMGIAAK
jgi:hypothetical protein